MELYLKRIFKTILFTGVLFAYIAYLIKTKNDVATWGQVLTLKFWILAVIHLIPSYFVVWSFEDKYESWTARRVILMLILILWAIVFGIIWAICHVVFNIELL